MAYSLSQAIADHVLIERIENFPYSLGIDFANSRLRICTPGDVHGVFTEAVGPPEDFFWNRTCMAVYPPDNPALYSCVPRDSKTNDRSRRQE